MHQKKNHSTIESRVSDCKYSRETRFSEVFTADRIFIKQTGFYDKKWGRGISPYGQISLQSGATSPTISNQVAISPTKHRLRLQYLLPLNHNRSKP